MYCHVYMFFVPLHFFDFDFWIQTVLTYSCLLTFHIVIINFLRSAMSDMTDFQEMLAKGGVRDTFNSSLKDL